MLSYQELLHDNSELRAKLDESEETLQAIRNGEVDAVIVSTSQGNAVYTLQSADLPYRVLIEEMHQGAVTILINGAILYSNRCFAEIVSYPLEGMLSRSIFQHIMPEDCQRFTEFIQAAQSSERIDGEFTLRNRQNEPVSVHIGANALQVGQLLILGLVVTDLRERKRAEAEFARLASIVTSSNDAIIGETLDGIITSWNRGAERIFGYTADEVIQKPITILVPRENEGESAVLIQKVVAGETVESFDTIRLKKDGNAIFVSVSISPIKDHMGRIVGVSKIAQDVTERKRTEETLRQSEERYRFLFEQMLNGLAYCRMDFNQDRPQNFVFLAVNSAFETLTGLKDIVGKKVTEVIPGIRESDAGLFEVYGRVALTGHPEKLETYVASLGMWFSISVYSPQKGYFVAVFDVITDRKQAEVKLAKVNRTLALISGVNQSIVRIRLLSELFEMVCRIAVEIGGFHMAWIGLLDSETGRVKPIAHDGVAEDYLELLDIVLDDMPRGHGPTATALRTSEPVIVNDIEHDPRMVPWRKDALRLGYRASAAFPINSAGEMRGVLNLYTNQIGFFDDDELYQLDEMVADISFAMEFAEKEAQRQQALLALQQQVQAVEAMQLFLQTTLDAFPANTVVLDPNGTIINVNVPWVRFADENSAPSPIHYLGANYLTVCDTANGDWSEEAASTADGIRAVIDGSQDEFYIEYPCHSPSEKRWFALRVTPFPKPAPHRVVVAHMNITERKQAEENLQNLYSELETRITVRTAELQMSKERVEAILNSSADAILLVNGDFSIQQTNASFNNLFGCKQDDYFGKSISTLLDDNDSDSMDRLLSAAADQSRLAIDVGARCKDTTIFAAELSISFIRDDSFVCAFHDISERKKIENSLHMTVKKEKELNELKTRFVSMASHEFRTPLATIHAATETLSAYRHKLTEDQIDLKLSNIRGQVGYLKDIMDDVLKLAQLQMRRVAFNPETVDLDALCREVIDEAQIGTDITHNILYTCARGLPTAHLDRKLLRQLVSNLLSNAIKYSPDSTDIIVNLEYTADTLVFKVSDSGIGIPEDDLTHLFEPFHRAANVGSIHGTGLGLVIAKESVELHGGTIAVESQIGTGTTFTVHIPIKVQGV